MPYQPSSVTSENHAAWAIPITRGQTAANRIDLVERRSQGSRNHPVCRPVAGPHCPQKGRSGACRDTSMPAAWQISQILVTSTMGDPAGPQALRQISGHANAEPIKILADETRGGWDAQLWRHRYGDMHWLENPHRRQYEERCRFAAGHACGRGTAPIPRRWACRAVRNG